MTDDTLHKKGSQLDRITDEVPIDALVFLILPDGRNATAEMGAVYDTIEARLAARPVMHVTVPRRLLSRIDMGEIALGAVILISIALRAFHVF